MQIITKSHIDDKHAAGEYFPMAESADGRFSWDCLQDSYVLIDASTGVSPNTPSGRYALYLPVADSLIGKDAGLTAEIVAAAREFSRAVDAEKQARHENAWKTERTEVEAERKTTQAAALAAAIASGKRAEMGRWMAECDGSVHECSTDLMISWMRPDGSQYVTRTHTF